MDNLDFSAEGYLPFDDYSAAAPNQQRFAYISSTSTWPLAGDNSMSQASNPQPGAGPRRAETSAASTTAPSASTVPLQTTGLAFPQPPQQTQPEQARHQQAAVDPTAALMASGWQYQLPHQGQQSYINHADINSSFAGNFGPLQSSPVDFSMPSTQAALSQTTLAMDPASTFMPFTSASFESMGITSSFQMGDFHSGLENYPLNDGMQQSSDIAPSSIPGGSPIENLLEVRSLSSSDNEWNAIDFPGRNSFHSYSDGTNNAAVFNPSQTLHIRTNSDSSQQSDVPPSAVSFSSWEEITFPLHSPESECMDLSHSQTVPPGMPFNYHEHDHAHQHSHSPAHSSVSPAALAEPMPLQHSASTSTSPSSSGASSPPSRRRKSPVGAKPAKTIMKKSQSGVAKKDSAEKRVGRRRGPLRPDQRQQAHEIRKLRACLRCKFLKKTCDKGDPCGGCQPSHARLWQVPCTRIDIKDIGYFMKDWKADFERHVSLGFSVGNIKGFSTMERPLFITHGYGYYLPITAREVYVRDDKCFGMDWVETLHEKPRDYEVTTAKLSAGIDGVSHPLLSEYLDRHIDGGFERFVDDYFEGTVFVTEILKTAYRYYLRAKLPVIRKALKLVLAYNLTLHVTLVEGLPEEESQIGKIDDTSSRFHGKTVAPVMINFQVKCALADMWRELQKDILEELSAMYSSVYSGEKLKNWPTIFMLAAILLAVWELMQFDCHYRVPDQAAVNKFCTDMETTPVGVIVGLFQAISQKLPSFSEWDTRKHHHLLNSDQAVCDALTEVRGHVTKYESYLKGRSEAKFDRNDFDCLSNKFLSKLVIRAN